MIIPMKIIIVNLNKICQLNNQIIFVKINDLTNDFFLFICNSVLLLEIYYLNLNMDYQ